jgi:hypothetical protein
LPSKGGSSDGLPPFSFGAALARMLLLANRHDDIRKAPMKGSIAFAIVSGAVGGTIAIALMEGLAARAAFPLFVVPFATSIVLVMGSPEAEPAPSHAP